jgi:hypothetical protein
MSIDGFLPGTREADVQVSLEGDFLHGRISVENETIPLDSNGRGRAMVRLIPPGIEVRLLLVTPAPAGYRFKVSINGSKPVGDEGVVGGGKVSIPFTFRFRDFEL